jgi:hypothetical protein
VQHGSEITDRGQPGNEIADTTPAAGKRGARVNPTASRAIPAWRDAEREAGVPSTA